MHALDESFQFRRVNRYRNVGTGPLCIRCEVFFEYRGTECDRGKTGVIAERMIALANNGIGKLVSKSGDASETHFIVRRRIHRRTIKERERDFVFPQYRNTSCDGFDVIHARGENYGLLETRDVFNKRIVVALTGADLVCGDVHAMQAISCRPREWR